MNVFLWIVQIALALQTFAGGAYKLVSFEAIASMPQVSAIPRGGWTAIGIIEMVCAVLLIVPAATKWMPVLTPIGAAVLALESFALAALYARHSLELSPSNPLIYVLLGGILAAFVAYGRYAIAPQG